MQVARSRVSARCAAHRRLVPVEARHPLCSEPLCLCSLYLYLYIYVRRSFPRVLASVLLLLRTLRIDGEHIVGIVRNSCATNGMACRILDLESSLDTIYARRQCRNAGPLSYVPTLTYSSFFNAQHTGDHFEFGAIDEFLTPWLMLVSHTSSRELLRDRPMRSEGYAKNQEPKNNTSSSSRASRICSRPSTAACHILHLSLF